MSAFDGDLKVLAFGCHRLSDGLEVLPGSVRLVEWPVASDLVAVPGLTDLEAEPALPD